MWRVLPALPALGANTQAAHDQPPSARCAQDEIEIGYTQAPHKALPVVFDSPRNRGLKEFPIKCLLVGAGGALAAETPALRPPSSLPVPPHPFSAERPAPTGAIPAQAASMQVHRVICIYKSLSDHLHLTIQPSDW